ncbi:hypothetical protein KJ969_04780 [Patescibacteria group bacterium]|nr:hypothetical protein [Patescibacteria group bacterium]MBU1921649.1 hypothetical protein [Patescibacteria group bacterium]
MDQEFDLEPDLSLDPKIKKQETILKILRQMRENANALISLIEQGDAAGSLEALNVSLNPDAENRPAMFVENEGRVLEGVFNGEIMIGSDGKEYSVPENYASKSKLIEGDILKLVINAEGKFVFKQIGPIERQRIAGKLAYDREKDEYRVISDERSWRVLTASVSYFKAQTGDEVVILVPKNNPSKWAAVENIIKK